MAGPVPGGAARDGRGEGLARHGRDGGSRCGRGKHPSSLYLHPSGKPMVQGRDGETGTPGRLAPGGGGAGTGWHRQAPVKRPAGTSQVTPQAPREVMSPPRPSTLSGRDARPVAPGLARCGRALRRSRDGGAAGRWPGRGATRCCGRVRRCGATGWPGAAGWRCDARCWGAAGRGDGRGGAAVRRPPRGWLVTARRRATPRLVAFGFWLTAAKAMSPRPPPIDLSPNQKKNTVGYALCRREWSSAPARGHVCGLGGDPHLVGGRGLSGVDCSQASCECEDDCEEVCGVGHAEA